MKDDPAPSLETVDLPQLLERMAELSQALLPEEVAYYPNRLTAQQRRQARNLAKTFLSSYPHLRELLKKGT